MRKIFRGAGSAALIVAATIFAMIVAAVSLPGCGFLKKLTKKDDAGVDAAPEAAAVAEAVDAAPAPVAVQAAENENDVARFPDEEKLDNVVATTLRPYNVREAPPAGAVVTALPKGTTVTQIARRDKYFIVVFDDPKASGKKLMGWIHNDAFSAIAVSDAAPNTIKCGAGEIALFSDSPFCGKACQKDAECPGGQACKGHAKKLTNGKAGASVTVCTVFHAHDAGAPAPPSGITDAGAKPDASVKSDGGVADAGAKPGPQPSADVVAPTKGKCPANYVLVAKTGKCHKACPNVSACRPTSFCIKCDADQKRVCGERRDQCK